MGIILGMVIAVVTIGVVGGWSLMSDGWAYRDILKGDKVLVVTEECRYVKDVKTTETYGSICGKEEVAE